MKIVYGVLKIVAYILILFFTIWVIEELVYTNVKTEYIRKLIMVLSFVCLGLLSFYLNKHFTKEDDILEFEREIDYLKNNIWTPLFWGGGLALLFIAVNGYFYKGKDNFVLENIFEISGILIGTISTIIIFRGIFQGIAPISSIERFLLIAAQDLKEKRYSRDGRVFLVYPALNIGYYREQIDEVPTKHYSEFMEALDMAKNNPKVEVKVVTYPQNLYQPLYAKYIEMNNKQNDDPNIEKCKNEANALFEGFKNNSHNKCTTQEIEPHKFPDHFLIVDNVVYLINTFGLPEYNTDTKEFFAPTDTQNPKEKLAKVYIYKQEDKILADLLIEKLNSIK